MYVFATSKQDRLYQLQMESLTGRQAGSKEHDIVVAEVFEHEQGHLGIEELPLDKCRQLEQQYHILPGHFKVVLVGKDLTVKLCADSCVSYEEIVMRVENDSHEIKCNRHSPSDGQ